MAWQIFCGVQDPRGVQIHIGFHFFLPNAFEPILIGKWPGAAKKDLAKLQLAQNKAARLALDCTHRTNINSMHEFVMVEGWGEMCYFSSSLFKKCVCVENA